MTTYFIKIILCSAVFLLTYKILLEKERIPLFNRFYILSSLILSFVIPGITLSSTKISLPIPKNEILSTNIFQYNSVMQIPITVNHTNYLSIFFIIIYVTITTLLLFRFIVNLRKILSQALTNQTISYKNCKIVLIEQDITPHSFLNYMFIYNKEYDNIENEILEHEYAHIKQRHTYDILLIEILQIFFWFNPMIYFYRKAILLNHEFLADEAVIKDSQNVSIYQYLLIDRINKVKTFNLTNQLNYSITKKRLLMMTKTKSLRSILCKQIAILPILTLSLFVFSTNNFAQDSLNFPKTKQKTPSIIQKGVTQEMLDEYEQIVNKTKNEEGIPVFSKFSDADKSRLETIYLSMSKDQQEKQIVGFIKAPPPLPKVVPTQTQIESWKNSKVYGIWINEKRVENSTFANYKNTDFSQVFVSKLAKNTVNYGKHYYQVDLMTTEHYDTYIKKKMENKEKFFMFILKGNKEGKVANKGKAIS
jgi:hypothetical protein